MSTIAEIVEAVKHLPPEEKRELMLRLEPVLFGGSEGERGGKTSEYLSDDFTKRLAAHFQKAKQAALGSR